MFSRNITQGFNNISELNSRQIQFKSSNIHRDLIEMFFFESTPIEKTLFFQSQTIMKALHSLSLKTYIPEISKFIEVMMDNMVCFDEKLKYLWFMKALHYRIINYHRKYISKYLPSCVYVLNEFYNPFERIKDNSMGCDQSEYIPSILLKYFEKLLNDNEEVINNSNNKYNEDKGNSDRNSINNILKNNIENKDKESQNFFERSQLNHIKRYENCLIIQELNRIFAEFSYKKSKTTIKSIIRTKWINRLNLYEAIQSLLYLLYYPQPSIKTRESSVPSKQNHHFNHSIDSMDEAKTFIKTLEEETPIKKSNISSIKSRYKENMLMKNPFAGKNSRFKGKNNGLEGKNFENVKEEEANDAMELHLEKYFPSKTFNTPFKEEEIKENINNKVSERAANVITMNHGMTVKKKLK